MILTTREGSGYVVCVRSETGFGSGLLRDKPWGTWHWWYLLGEMCLVPTRFELLSRILWCLGCDSWFCILIFNEVPQSLQTNVWPNSHSFNISPWCQNFFGWTSYPRKGTCADFEIVKRFGWPLTRSILQRVFAVSVPWLFVATTLSLITLSISIKNAILNLSALSIKGTMTFGINANEHNNTVIMLCVVGTYRVPLG